MKNDELLERMSEFGYQLLMPGNKAENVKLLNKISESEDLRILEGFPVVLFNMINSGDIKCSALKKLSERLKILLHLSFACFRINGYGYLFHRFKEKTCELSEETINEYADVLKKRGSIKLGNVKIDAERLIRNFDIYTAKQRTESVLNKLETTDEMAFQQSLNTLFPEKQKEIVLKKFKNEILTKTEKEYFSRIIKKRINAVLNEDLQKMLKAISK